MLALREKSSPLLVREATLPPSRLRSSASPTWRFMVLNHKFNQLKLHLEPTYKLLKCPNRVKKWATSTVLIRLVRTMNLQVCCKDWDSFQASTSPRGGRYRRDMDGVCCEGSCCGQGGPGMEKTLTKTKTCLYVCIYLCIQITCMYTLYVQHVCTYLHIYTHSMYTSVCCKHMRVYECIPTGSYVVPFRVVY